MIKNFRIAIDLTVDISERITSDLITKAKKNTVGDSDVQPRQEYLDMLQDIISYIINHQDLHAECIYGKLLFKLGSYNTNEEFYETTELEPDSFEKNILKAAEALGPAYVKFIKQLYQDHPDKNDKVKAGKEEIPQEEQKILIELLRLCLVDSTISLS